MNNFDNAVKNAIYAVAELLGETPEKIAKEVQSGNSSVCMSASLLVLSQANIKKVK